MSYAEDTIREIQWELRQKSKVEEVIQAGLWDCLKPSVKAWYTKFTKHD